MVAHFDIGAIERADRQRTIERELHIARARSFHARSRDLLREIRRRNDDFRERHIVVRNEDDLQKPAHGRIVVDDSCDVVGQFDDQFRVVIAGRCLARENLNARDPIKFRM